MCFIVKSVYFLLLSGQTTYFETYTLAHLPDDMTVGLTIGESLQMLVTSCMPSVIILLMC